MLKNNATSSFALTAAFAAASLASTGCRSMPGASMFGFRPKPTAEALAGSGPSTTYPAPPSHSATPQAIASVAGGTGESKSKNMTAEASANDIAGFDISPGYAVPGSESASNETPAGASTSPSQIAAANRGNSDAATGTTANLAAAQANGIYSGAVSASPATYKTSPAPTRQPSGYTFGNKALTPKTSPQESSEGKLAGHSVAPSNGEFTVPSTSYEGLPASTSANSSSQGGFTLPTDSPALSSLTPPPTANESAVNASLSSNAADDTGAAAEYSTASTSPAEDTTAPAPFSSHSAGGQYTPGSTGSSTGYPTGNTSQSTSGSFYR